MKRATVIALIVLLIAGAFVSCNYDNIIDDEFNPAIDITSETITLIPGSRYRTVEDTTIADRVTIDGKGTVTIILKEGTTLTAEKGINVTDDQELHIIGEGKLVATGDEKSAGIGGGENEDGGTIVIQGGDITANGGSEGGAGIGGGKGGKGGTTIIETLDDTDAPEVTTKGGNAGADGIGNGDGATGDPETVELDGVGLEVSADGLTWEDYDDANPHPKQYMRTFVGATITFNANGGTGDMAAQTIHINKATALKPNTFTKEGEIFKGWNTKADGSGDDYADKASIEISADITLYAQWEVAPTGNYITSETTSIKAGLTWTIKENVVNNNRITIDGTEETTIFLPAGKKLTLTKGINVITPQTLIIDGDSTGILISGGSSTTPEGAAGIGGYGESERLYVCGIIIIKNGDITAYGGNGGNGGAGIGGGYRGSGGEINITGGKVEAYAGTNAAGIGGGLEGSGGTINITGGKVEAYAGTNAEGIGKGYNGASSGTLNLPEGTLVSDDEITWSNYDGTNSKRYMKTATILSSSTTAWTDGNFYTLSENVTISDERVIVTGSVNLILPAGKTLTIPKGITVADTNSLSIEGTGTLTINDVDTNNSGIGGDSENPNAGTITINGVVNINTTGGGNGAGIGGGKLGSGGTININGGIITSVGASAAGIGGGYNSSSIGQITITGGLVITTGGIAGAGIGGGYHGLTGTILISGGTVNAEGGIYSAGIGSGDGNSETPNSIEITISGAADVTATGGEYGAGIGGGSEAVGGTISIQGGTIVATGGINGAGIGGGAGGNGGVITISGVSTDITATGGSTGLNGGAGIGGGDSGSSGTITIEEGFMIKAYGHGYAAGIGGGSFGSGESIEISGGTIHACGDDGASGIGGGTFGNGGTITLKNSPKVKAEGGAKDDDPSITLKPNGIGRGQGTETEDGTLTVTGLAVTLQVSDSKDSGYTNYDGSTRKRYMKTSNY